MPTINQLINKKRITKKTRLKRSPALSFNPQKSGTCLAVLTKTPRKPNSALRKIAKVRLVNSKIVSVFIPGEGHNISRFSDIVIVGRRIRDLPGIKYGAVRGKMDLNSVLKKKNGRSKYGTKKDKSSRASQLTKQKKLRNFNVKHYHFAKKLSQNLKQFIKNPDALLIQESAQMAHHLLLYRTYIRLKHLQNKKKQLENRNSSFGTQLTVKPKSLKKAWKETKNVISGIKRSISNKENLRRLDSILKKTKNMNLSNSKNTNERIQKNHYDLLEVSQTLRIIRVLDLKSNKVLRYSF